MPVFRPVPCASRRATLRAALCAGLCAGLASALAAASASAAPPVFAPWIAGQSPSEPQTQVQRIDPDTFVIRQSLRTDFEAPFLYLLFGKDRALLIDSGAGGLDIRAPVDAVIADWLRANNRTAIPLVVAHSHSHGDHHQGDSQFAGRPDTQVIGLQPQEVAAFFGIKDWPESVARFHLGGRNLSIIPTPGHEPSHIMVWDPRTRLMFSGDMLYPGRIYVPVDQWPVFVASADRLAAFAKAHRIEALLGAHIEMTNTPGKDFRSRAPVHADEHPLPLPSDAITRLQTIVTAAAGTPARSNAGDFIVYPVPPQPAP
jgi:glyoxylase-like metal-dependent hydrolase (beta-lactamase superfamily II)